MFSEGFMRDFFRLPHAKEPAKRGINRTCPKCGDPFAQSEWEGARKELHMQCVSCRFGWWVKPLDHTDNTGEKP